MYKKEREKSVLEVCIRDRVCVRERKRESKKERVRWSEKENEYV